MIDVATILLYGFDVRPKLLELIKKDELLPDSQPPQWASNKIGLLI